MGSRTPGCAQANSYSPLRSMLSLKRLRTRIVRTFKGFLCVFRRGGGGGGWVGDGVPHTVEVCYIGFYRKYNFY